MKKRKIFFSSFVISTLFISQLWTYPTLTHTQKEVLATEPTKVSTKITGGYGHAFILKEDGTVWGFGYNQNGELGLNTKEDSFAPKRIPPSYFKNKKVTHISSSSRFTLAVTEDHSVYYWGNGVIIPNFVTQFSSPVKKIDTIGEGPSAMQEAFFMLTEDGRVWTFGNNFVGQLGNGLSGRGGGGYCAQGEGKYVIQPVLKDVVLENCTNGANLQTLKPGSEVPLSNVVDISSNRNGLRYAMALTKDNEVYMWGQSYPALPKKRDIGNLKIKKVIAGVNPLLLTEEGELYRFTNLNDKFIKVNMENPSEIIKDVQITHKGFIFLMESGKVYAYGLNAYGQFGNKLGETEASLDKNSIRYTGIDNIKTIGGGLNSTYYEKNDGTFYGMGMNGFGQLSNINDNSKSTFTPIPIGSKIKLIDANIHSTFAVDETDRMYTWGEDNRDSLLKPMGRVGPNNIPALVSNFNSYGGIKSLNGRNVYWFGHTAITNDGKLLIWGDSHRNGTGGMSKPNGMANPLYNLNNELPPSDLSFFIDSTQGYFNGVGITKNGEAYSWGIDFNGALGTGKLNREMTPENIEQEGSMKAFQKVAQPNDVHFVSVDNAYNTFYALDTNKNVWAWGDNNGKLGYTAQNNYSHTPKQVTSISNIKQVEAGSNFAMALDENGDVWTWGQNDFGQLGLGHANITYYPTKISSLPKIKKIATGFKFAFAIAENGDVYAWGDNRYGQLSLGDRVSRTSPRKVQFSKPVESIRGGENHAILLTTTGEVFTAGSNSFGQLGTGEKEGIDTLSLIVFPPIVTITTPNNQTVEYSDTFTVKGNVFIETLNVPVRIVLKIEGTEGSREEELDSFVATNHEYTFEKKLAIDPSQYKLNGYTVTLQAITTNGYGEHAINFGVLDKKSPTITVNPLTTSWSANDTSITVSNTDEGGSGYRGFMYAWSKSNQKPEDGWSSIMPKANETLLQKEEDSWYLHIQSFDNSGNTSYKMTGPYQIDKTNPSFDIQYPKDWQQNELTFSIKATDNMSGIQHKKWLTGKGHTPSAFLTNGNNIDFTTKTITKNQIISFYSEDKAGNYSIQEIDFRNINHTPTFTDQTKPKQLILQDNPYASLKGTIQDEDEKDNLYVHITNDNESKQEFLQESQANVSIPFQKQIDVSSFATNQTHQIRYYIVDDKNGNSKTSQLSFEYYHSDFHATSVSTKEIDLAWNISTLFPRYQIKRDGNIVYEGTQNNWKDISVEENKTYRYELFLWDEESWKKTDVYTAKTGEFSVQVPSTLSFPQVKVKKDITETTTSFADSIYITNTTNLSTPWRLQAQTSSLIHQKTNHALQHTFTIKQPIVFHNKNPLEFGGNDILLQTENDTTFFEPNPSLVQGEFELQFPNNSATIRFPSVQKLGIDTVNNYQNVITWKIVFGP